MSMSVAGGLQASMGVSVGLQNGKKNRFGPAIIILMILVISAILPGCISSPEVEVECLDYYETEERPGPFVVTGYSLEQEVEDHDFAAGEKITMRVKISNTGPVAAQRVSALLLVGNLNISLTGQNQGFGDIPAGEETWTTGSYAFIALDGYNQESITFKLRITDRACTQWNSTFSIK